MSTCLSPELFDYSTARMDIFHLSTLLGSKFMDAYVGLIASQKLQTELYILSYLLKDRVYPGDLWELVGERSIEAMQEETLYRHQAICNAGRDRGRHAAVERFLMEERKKRCQMEVSLYSQAIEILEQFRMPHIGAPAKHEIKTPSATLRHVGAPSRCLPLPCAPLACSISTRAKCEAWLIRNDAYLNSAGLSPPLESSPSLGSPPLLEGSPPFGASPPSSLGQPPSAQEEPVHDVLDRIGSSPPLLSTWITADVQEAFYEAFQTELDMQSELMSKSFVARRSNANLRNHGLDLLILQAKMHRAQAEITLYTLALENTHAFDFSDHSSQTSWDRSVLRPILSDELHYCDVDADDDSDQLHHDDFEIAFSPNGQLVATGGRENTIFLWDISQESTIMTNAVSSSFVSPASHISSYIDQPSANFHSLPASSAPAPDELPDATEFATELVGSRDAATSHSPSLSLQETINSRDAAASPSPSLPPQSSFHPRIVTSSASTPVLASPPKSSWKRFPMFNRSAASVDSKRWKFSRIGSISQASERGTTSRS
ncbi:hypothetical protein C8R48DRAFT_779277 [Suillus tomentosus]|nr:hypothetical protein C8R48DRAFT_779277 [Suillus tomentosus]